MEVKDLLYSNLMASVLKPYEKRATDISARFLRWFLENIMRLDQQDADDACVDSTQDKGIDGIYVNDVAETIYLIQVKRKQKESTTLGDTELKEFFGSLQQFKSVATIKLLLEGDANEKLKQAIRRNKISEKITSGYKLEGMFCTNVVSNKAATDYLDSIDGITLYDAQRIVEEYIELGGVGGIKEDFIFNVSDTEVINYKSSDKVSARIFLADALQLLHLKGINDGKLFEQNVRLTLGNTKVNKSLISSIKKKEEHRNFPLYHNGITILCEKFLASKADQLGIRNYVVVNGAQSLTSLNHARSSISSDLKILVKAVEIKGDSELSDKITTNSNNQNAIKPRDMRSNHGIQQRLKVEISAMKYEDIVYEVKRGENNKGKVVISNEDAGLVLLALDVGEPWNCHQKYKVMDESHSKIFGRPDVDGPKIIALYEAFHSVESALDSFDDETFSQYTLTKYFLSYAVSEIIKDSEKGKKAFQNFRKIYDDGNLEEFVKVFANIALTTADDLNAEITDDGESVDFDYKSDLKSPTWGRKMVADLKASYKKDVKRKKAESVDELFADII